MRSTPADVVLTGLPRSGTTLVCHLLNKVPNTLALHEPMDPTAVAAQPSPQARCGEIRRFFGEVRESIRQSARAPSKQFEGRVPDNPVGDRPGPSGLRESLVTSGFVAVTQHLDPDFLLAVKHNAMFTALLGPLTERFTCYAVIRNPLAVLASWQTVEMPVHEGHAPAAEAIDPGLAKTLGRIPDRTDRQLALLSWFYERYRTLLPSGQVLRYEELVASSGRSLAVVAEAAGRLAEPLASRNRNELYDRSSLAGLASRLLESDGAYWAFYDRDAVTGLLDTVESSLVRNRRAEHGV